MNTAFEFVRDNILRGMPSGCLVTKDNVEFDIGRWQHKSYRTNDNIRGELRGKWCPASINILILDTGISQLNIETFIDDNDFQKNGRYSYLVFTMVIPQSVVDNKLYSILTKSKFSFTRYSSPLIIGDYFIFLNDFIRPIIYI